MSTMFQKASAPHRVKMILRLIVGKVVSGWVASVRVFLNTHTAAGSWGSSSPSPLNPEVKDLTRAQKENNKGCKNKSGAEHSASRPRHFCWDPGEGSPAVLAVFPFALLCFCCDSIRTSWKTRYRPIGPPRVTVPCADAMEPVAGTCCH